MSVNETEQSVRDDLAVFITTEVDWEEPMWSAVVIAEQLLASPVVRRIQAEAWDDGFDSGHYINDEEDRDCGCRFNPYRTEEDA